MERSDDRPDLLKAMEALVFTMELKPTANHKAKKKWGGWGLR